MASGYNLDAAQGHAFGPTGVSKRRTAERVARRRMDEAIEGTPRQRAQSLKRFRQQHSSANFAPIDQAMNSGGLHVGKFSRRTIQG